MVELTKFYREFQLDKDLKLGLDLSTWLSLIETSFEKGNLTDKSGTHTCLVSAKAIKVVSSYGTTIVTTNQ